MNLGFKTKFADGSPSNFPAKILLCSNLIPTIQKLEVTALGRFYHWEEMMTLKEKGVRPKIHTVRGVTDKWRPGITIIHFATGIRTKAYTCFAKGVCLYTHPVKMYQNTPESPIQIYVSEKHVDTTEFYLNDGFDDYESFHRWFSPLIQAELKAGKPFYGAMLIGWEEASY